MKAYSMTHVGLVREQNEDTVRVCSGAHGLYILADGMGGHQAGEVASAMAAEILQADLSVHAPAKELLLQAYAHANKAIYEKQLANPAMMGMGTTLTVLWENETHVLIGHVGDSRAYLLLDGKLRRMTEDHSLVGELLRSGAITEEQARRHPYRSVITRAVGTDQTVQVDVQWILKAPGTKWLLCSDGLTDMVSDQQIEYVLSNFEGEAAVRLLIDHALQAGGRDNVSVMVLEVGQ